MFNRPNLSKKELDDSLKESEEVVNNIKSMANQMFSKLAELKRINDALNSGNATTTSVGQPAAPSTDKANFKAR